jgi:hypothetical protein
MEEDTAENKPKEITRKQLLYEDVISLPIKNIR